MEMKLSLDPGVTVSAALDDETADGQPLVSLDVAVNDYPDFGAICSLTPKEASELGAALIAFAVEADMKKAASAAAAAQIPLLGVPFSDGWPL